MRKERKDGRGSDEEMKQCLRDDSLERGGRWVSDVRWEL